MELKKNSQLILQHILRNPGDLSARLAFADACREEGDEDRADFVEKMLEVKKLVGKGRKLIPKSHYDDRLDGEVAKLVERTEKLLDEVVKLYVAFGKVWFMGVPACFNTDIGMVHVEVNGDKEYVEEMTYESRWHAGFFDEAYSTYQNWFEEGPRLVAAHPIRTFDPDIGRPEGIPEDVLAMFSAETIADIRTGTASPGDDETSSGMLTRMEVHKGLVRWARDRAFGNDHMKGD